MVDKNHVIARILVILMHLFVSAIRKENTLRGREAMLPTKMSLKGIFLNRRNVDHLLIAIEVIHNAINLKSDKYRIQSTQHIF